MIYRRKNTQKRNNKNKPVKTYNHVSEQQPKKVKDPKRQRLIQVEAEIQELVHKHGSHSQEQMDKLMLERWQLRYQLNL
ncbi:MAG: hypothetical protein CBD16_02710 [Betaproteobacteria bacterium TMED156]|nr:MAG: hypothetical protein CBD16_02710 [Betaproteobacteria bacterium TMED156]|tara:strand:- start:264 stop:500 length:237 start_codon:yes stop_codon:yes gene_type:complete